MAVIAHFGTFDVENYGDLLFPAIFERRLGDLGHTFVHVSPHGGPAVWGDCVSTVASEALIDDPPDLAGVVVGGGHILHGSPSSLDRYDQGGLSSIVAYPSLWLGAAYLAASRNAPFCWNAPGVPQTFSQAAAPLVAWSASIADYLSVRDRASHARLVNAGVASPIHVIPDTALEIARVWSSEQLDEAFIGAFRTRGREVRERTIAIHLNSRYAGEDLDLLAARLDRIAQRLHATPILIAIGPCHGDDQLQRNIGQLMESEPLVIDRPQSLREVTACIARSELYLGSSLHGLISACSFGTRGMVVIPDTAGTVGKFTGFLETFQLHRWRAETWQEVEERLDELVAAPSESWTRVLSTAMPLLDEHWGRLRAVIARHADDQANIHRRFDKQVAIERLEPSPGWPRMLYAPLVAEQAVRAIEHRRTATEERSRKEWAITQAERLRAERDRLREELDELRSAAVADRRSLEDTIREGERRLALEEERRKRILRETERLQADAVVQRQLQREVKHLRDLFERAVPVDEQNAKHLLRAELRLAEIGATLLRLEKGASAKRRKRLRSQAKRGVFRVQEELARVKSLKQLVPQEGSTSDAAGHLNSNEPDDDPDRVLPGAPRGQTPNSIAEGNPNRSWESAPPRRVTPRSKEIGGASSNGQTESWSVDITVCVHNALQDVTRCLRSVVRNTDSHHRVFIVDDGSEANSASFLQALAAAHPQITLIRNDERLGYTKAANQGLRASTGDMVVLLNSDTIVPPLWLDRLVECARSDPGVGIVGPLSNAASYQSVPERFDANGDWAVNSLPPGLNVDDLAAAVAEISDRTFPRVPFVNGFCFAIKRSVIEAIGYLDEENFPDGYGEENDYCLRAAEAGFELAIADHAYVYHAKSRSYSHDRRRELGKVGGKALHRKHPGARIEVKQAVVRDEPTLAAMRERVSAVLKGAAATPDLALSKAPSLSVLFLVPVSGGGGGVHSVVQETSGMRRLGINAQVAVQARHLPRYRENYAALDPDRLFFGYRTLDELISYAPNFTVVVGTIYTSMPLVAAIVSEYPEVVPAYYVQDYEPLFFPKDSIEWKAAARSYTLVPDAVLFAKTQWLCDIVRMRHDVEVHKVSPSIDHDVYFPPSAERDHTRVVVAAMIRPSSPRRGAQRTMSVLKRLNQEFDERVDVHTFGCTDETMAAAGLPVDFHFTNHGTLIREQVAELLRDCDVFLDLSDYQAFGRTGLEAMACGCAVVVPATGGTAEYAVDRENALVVETGQHESCYEAARELVADPRLRERLGRAGLAKAGEYSVSRASISELNLFETVANERNPLLKTGKTPGVLAPVT